MRDRRRVVPKFDRRGGGKSNASAGTMRIRVQGRPPVGAAED
jgi:hypothetical protein